MYLIVGLGNPGGQYERTRHNIGFLAVERLTPGVSWKTEAKYEAEVAKDAEREMVLAKPQTYMNLSGQSVGAISRFYKIPAENVIVIQDDIDLPLGTIRIRKGGSAGGHNGIKSVTEAIGAEFIRVKLGVSNPKYEKEAKDFVLGKFVKDEMEEVEGMLDKIPDIISAIIEKGLEEAQNRFN